MRVMAIDYGDARTGIAVSDAMGLIAGETFVIAEWDAAALSTLFPTANAAGRCGG